MEKLFKFLGIALMALVVVSFCSCSNDDEDPTPTPTKVTFVAPCIDWSYNLDQIRAYMAKTLPDYKEGEAYTSSGETIYPFSNKNGDISYSYHFDGGEFVSCGVDYLWKNEQFDSLKSQVSTMFGIEKWYQQQSMSGVDWWGAVIDKNTEVFIGKGTQAGGYMYVSFSSPRIHIS